MHLVLRNAKGDSEVKFNNDQLINVNGVIFKLCVIDFKSKKITLQPASIDQTKQFMAEAKPEIKKPVLGGDTTTKSPVSEKNMKKAALSNPTPKNERERYGK